MRAPVYLIRRQKGGWVFRQQVPRHLRPAIRRTTFTHTLTAQTGADAVAQASALRTRYAWAFHAWGNGMAGPEDDEWWMLVDGEWLPRKMVVAPPPGESWDVSKLPPPPPAPPSLLEPLTEWPSPRPLDTQSKAGGPPLEEVLGVYWPMLERAAEHAPDTIDARKRAAQSFIDFKGVGPRRLVGTVSQKLAVAWLDHLLGVDEAADGKRRSRKTVQGYATHLRQIWEWLAERGDVPRNANPFSGIIKIKKSAKKARRRAGYGWEGFDAEQLRVIFAPANLKRARTIHVRWGVLIGLFTGARVGEVAQIYLRDFTEADGLPCLLIRAESEGQRLKTEQSERLIPLHPDLIRLGLLEHVAALRAEGEERLFNIRLDSKAGTGATISKGFTNYLKAVKVGPRRSVGRVGFHSFRKTMTQALQAAGLSDERRRAYLGHEPGEDDSHGVAYMRPWTPKEFATLHQGMPWGQWLDINGLRPLLFPAVVHANSVDEP